MLAPTPPMGFNSWNTFGAEIDENLLLETARAMVDEGLLDAGYEYVVIDDLWEADERVNGRLTWDVEKFPHGIPFLAEMVHELGLKLGLYSCAGTHTCARKPSSYGYEEVDAETFAEWGVDFLKYDYCYVPAGVDGPSLFRRMGQALRATGRPILYSICEWGANDPWRWGASAGGHMWRTTPDIFDSWESIRDIGFDRQAELYSHAGPGGWNDPDMLVVGMCGKGNVARGGCSDVEYRTHFGQWCLLAAPLMIGCDVRSMNGATKEILLNCELIAVNQDELGRQAWRIGRQHYGRHEVWAKPLADGSIAVGLFNLSELDRPLMNVSWEAIGLQPGRACSVRDLWRHEDLGVHTGSFCADVPVHDSVVVRITPLR